MRINLDEHCNSGSLLEQTNHTVSDNESTLADINASSLLADTVRDLAEYKLSDKNTEYVISTK